MSNEPNFCGGHFVFLQNLEGQGQTFLSSRQLFGDSAAPNYLCDQRNDFTQKSKSMYNIWRPFCFGSFARSWTHFTSW